MNNLTFQIVETSRTETTRVYSLRHVEIEMVKRFTVTSWNKPITFPLIESLLVSGILGSGKISGYVFDKREDNDNVIHKCTVTVKDTSKV